ncbi:hypothetical protein K457DRAFT_126152 [Linnemannia elongata AG-77]|uniref:Zn(2)-C6 fungal-type domain-containing protein n=1 Tax=Linnemannia elongata AG-77 TaxID=1314771 RepID=A0A197JY19_9FUNG|nr:hypothetical protein K457DRAFT_126152 [Linnemannia elongata AG-77]
MPMQAFEFQADASVSLSSPAAIIRKSCDHCFLNRKTCDKVREDADSGEKCRRCAKDNRPCTFTPTVHLYHIADCVGRHQCRAKVIQAMGGRKKEVQLKTIEIPIVCDMDSAVDMALYEFIKSQPNLLVYNNRIKSFLAQDMLGVNPDHDDVPPLNLGYNYYSQSAAAPANVLFPVSPSNASKRSFVGEPSSFGSNASHSNSITGSPSQGPQKFRVLSPIDPQQQQQQQVQQQQRSFQQAQHTHPYQRHQKTTSTDGGRSPRNSISPFTQAAQMHHATKGASMGNPDLSGVSPSGRLSPVPGSDVFGTSPNAMENYYGMFQQPLQSQTTVEPVQNHPYNQVSPYPQAFFNMVQQQQQQPQQHSPQLESLSNYRSPRTYPTSPSANSPLQASPLPPSPLELSMAINTNFGSFGNGSNGNLPSLFDQSLSMGLQSPQQPTFHQHQRHLSVSSTHSSISGSPMLNSDNNSNLNSTPEPASTVVTTFNGDGQEVGVYYAIPDVSLNPGFTDSDLFQDMPMRNAVGEEFTWVENLFEGTTDAAGGAGGGAGGVAGSNPTAMPMTVAGGNITSINPSALSTSNLADQWSSQYSPFDNAGNGNDGAGGLNH